MFPQRPMPPMGPAQRGMMRLAGRIPMNGGQPFNGGFNGGQFLGQGARTPFGGMAGGQNFGAQQLAGRAGGGGLRGLLSKIMPFGQGAGNAGAGGAARGLANLGGAAQGGSGVGGVTQGLSSLANPSNISGMLGNVQKALGMAQQVTPMIQQYGPLVKNLPAMYRIFSQLKSGGNDDSSEENQSEVSDEKKNETPASAKAKQKAPVSETPDEHTPSAKVKQKAPVSETPDETEDAPAPKKTVSGRKPGTSTPRMYV
ncbi:VrrA/YqfQ family protein [Metabacillus sp. RGM 3146]|uniref:VrrA/YqfQ family protein n=1 Tax=Metabacillus sp. RGM 3146 TaxID=3401092 RepID=UPI003B9911C0